MFDVQNALVGFDDKAVFEYETGDCATFRKTKEKWGEYSNMASGFPLTVNGVSIKTSEALYQACRFPHMPELQRVIIDQASPMAAKMKGKPHRGNSRPDFDALRVQIMWWTLRVKLACNLRVFGRELLNSGNMPIVEHSHRDTFWGAVIDQDGKLTGQNVLGRLLVILRDGFQANNRVGFDGVEPLAIPQFSLFGELIRCVE